MGDHNKNDLKFYPKIINIELGIINTGFTEEPNDSTLPSYIGADSDYEKNENDKSEKALQESSSPDQNGISNPDDENESNAKETWGRPIQFLLSCISMSVGLGNIWRFPFTAYQNGGGAFLLPYFVSLLLVGRPMYYLEMCIGQFASSGPVKIWEVAPFFKGIGYAAMMGSISTCSFYCSIIALVLSYLKESFTFTSPLPWSEDACYVENITSSAANVCHLYDIQNLSYSEVFYNNQVFPQLDNIDQGIGMPHWPLGVGLSITWVCIFLCLAKGIKSQGKVAYFTATFPYLVLICLLIRGITLPGSLDGIYYFLYPQWEKILSPDVWFAAVSQSFFSLTVGFGTIPNLASHNKINHNVYRDSMIVSVTDTFTSVLAGCSIFSILGYLAHSTGVDISEVTKGGPGLAFIAFPEAIAKMTHFAPALAVAFFIMLFTLGIGSAVALTSQVINIIHDNNPSYKGWAVTLVVCFLGFLSGLVYITPGGPFILTLVNYHGADFIIYTVALLEIIAIAWVYGVDRFSRDIKFMLGRETGIFWKVCWKFIMPIFLFSLLAYNCIQYKWLTYKGVALPGSAIASGWVLTVMSLSFLPLCAIQAVRNSPGETWLERLKASLRPTSAWGPKLPADRALWLKMKAEEEENEVKMQTDRISTASTATQKSDAIP
ncbi:unnamed protein product [Orchesella dallaii]|uniref:Transporter n=1 Tax=Orchesella dallaii TaxID=48710 RepID=A0ABP1QPV7_9HEXA